MNPNEAFELGCIDSSGVLLIERIPNDLQKQYCPFHPEREICGDHCPLFGEPVRTSITLRHSKIEFELTICQNRTLYFKNFKDNRNEG